MNAFQFQIITPDRILPEREIVFLDVPAEEGRLTVLAGHQPFICSLRAGEIKLRSGEGESENISIGPGTMTVTPDGVTLLVRNV